MKKVEYMTPEMEVVELNSTVALLAGSDGGGSTSSADDPDPAEDGDY